MEKRITDRLTPITPQKFLTVLGHAWANLFNEPPKKEALLVLMAQSAFETGRWKYIHNYNFGNVKGVPAGDGRDYTYYACNEILDAGAAAAYQAKSTSERPAKVVSTRDNKSEIWFYPEHPGCCFRAYAVLDDQDEIDEEASVLAGMTDYLGLLSTRFSKAWTAVQSGDVDVFVRQLKAAGYFTDALEHYLSQVTSLFKEFSRLDLDLTVLPIMSDAARERTMALISLTYQESIKDLSESS